MSKIGVNISIDVTKLDKARFVEGKNGQKYCDLTAFIDLDNPDQYGNNGIVKQGLKKGEDKNTVLPILGNSRVFWKENQQQQHQQGIQQAQKEWSQDDMNDSIPF